MSLRQSTYRKENIRLSERDFKLHGAHTPGICRVCGCTELDACLNEWGDPCAWDNDEETLCDNELCRIALAERG